MFSLFPKDEDFFLLFRRQAELVRLSCDQLHEMMEKFDRLEERAKALKETEHRADLVTHELFERLNRTFITPLERDDIQPRQQPGRRAGRGRGHRRGSAFHRQVGPEAVGGRDPRRVRPADRAGRQLRHMNNLMRSPSRSTGSRTRRTASRGSSPPTCSAAGMTCWT
jgi:hypothetical protein